MCKEKHAGSRRVYMFTQKVEAKVKQDEVQKKIKRERKKKKKKLDSEG